MIADTASRRQKHTILQPQAVEFDGDPFEDVTDSATMTADGALPGSPEQNGIQIDDDGSAFDFSDSGMDGFPTE